MPIDSLIIQNESEMLAAGQTFSLGLRSGDIVHLSGDLGAGKTTFVRGALHGLGYNSEVLSPTFSLVETYPLKTFTVVHFDLYRLEHEQELELIGFRDYFINENVIFIEWPDRAMEMLPAPDYDIRIQQQEANRQILINKISNCESN